MKEFITKSRSLLEETEKLLNDQIKLEIITEINDVLQQHRVSGLLLGQRRQGHPDAHRRRGTDRRSLERLLRGGVVATLPATVLRIHGPGAVECLQSILSNDIEGPEGGVDLPAGR